MTNKQTPVRVLYMEDDRGVARLVEKRLRRAGFVVDVAHDGEEGLGLFDPSSHDVVLIDHQMPVYTGLEVIRLLSQRGALPPIIVVTGGGNESLAVEALKLGARDYLVKDTDLGFLSLLPSVIGSVLDQVRLEEEKAEADAALQRYAAELEDRNQELDAFAHTVAHDLKSPLQQVVGYAYVLRREHGEQLDVLGRECLEGISRGVATMSSIIQELLMLASVRKEDVPLETLSMAEIVEAALGRLKPMIEDSQAAIAAPESWPAALGYGPWVQEVWVNYVSNAVKYGGNPEEGIPPRVELGYSEILGEGEASVRFWVRDNGLGLTAEEQELLFRPFTRLERMRAKGHGLGLSIVRRIIEKLGGRTGVHSQKGGGSTFSFTLPEPT
jgi:signal transduction histidine kinase